MMQSLQAFFQRRTERKWSFYLQTAFGVLGFVYAFRCIQFLDLNWLIETDGIRQALWAAHLGWAALSLLIVFNRGGIWIKFAHFFLVATILNMSDIPHSVEVNLYLILSFWLPWTDFKREREENSLVWPLAFLSFNLLLCIFGAAVSKTIDPLWRVGVGFAYALSIPEKAAYVGNIASDAWYAHFLNYSAMALQMSLLPLFCFRKTRPACILLTATFFSGFFFPWTFHLIASLGFCICIAMVGVWRSNTHPVEARPEGRPVSSLSWQVPVAAFVLIGSLGVANIFCYVWPKRTPDFLKRDGIVHMLNKASVHMFVWAPFTSGELLNVALYRVRFYLNDGQVKEPWMVFSEDQKAGRDTGWFLTVNPKQLTMFFSRIAQKHVGKPDDDLAPAQRNKILSLIRFAQSQLDKEDQNKVTKAEILLSQLSQPPESRKAPRWDAFIEFAGGHLTFVAAQ